MHLCSRLATDSPMIEPSLLTWESTRILSSFDLNEDACGISAAETATQLLEFLAQLADADFEMVMSGAGNNWNAVKVSKGTKTSVPGITSTPIDYKHQQDALLIEFDGKPAQIYVRMLGHHTLDARGYIRSGGHLLFDIDLISEMPKELKLAMHCTWPAWVKFRYLSTCQRLIDQANRIGKRLRYLYQNLMKQAQILNLSSPFLIYSEHPVRFRLGSIRFQPD